MDQGARLLSLSRGRRLLARLQGHPEFGALIGFLTVFIGFAVSTPHFLTPASIANILTVVAELGVVSVGVTFLMIAGEFDLSVGSVLAVTAMSFALMAKAEWPHLLALFLAIGLAVLIGWLNGVITVKAGIPSFITTLGTMMFWRGILLAVTGGFPISYWGRSGLLLALNGKFAGDFRMSAIWLGIIVAIFAVLLTRTPYGNAVFAVGGNREAARTLGVNVNRVKISCFIITAVLAGLAGIIQFARFKTVDPLRGTGLELEAIAAAVIGGTLLTGGYGSVVGTLLGVLLIGMVYSGLVMAGAPAYWYRAFIGVILIVAVIVNTKVRARVGR